MKIEFKLDKDHKTWTALHLDLMLVGKGENQLKAFEDLLEKLDKEFSRRWQGD